MSQSALHARTRYRLDGAALKLNATLGAFAHAPLQKLARQEPRPESVRFDTP
jgi:hypothetical protein